MSFSHSGQFKKSSEEDNALGMIKYYKWFDQTFMKRRFNVLVTRRLHAEALEKLGKKCNITLHTGKIPMPKKILVSKIKNADGLVCHPYDTVDKDVISNG